ncbi:hypothetical protein NPIL_406931 [Nephila pilipes]|uniref:Uncharacterized protein n=1 Tax=Nephila pilipes TaxID=299642 RepID=A0A8X6QZ13_NEPPI|nr:hypothetical protein NPIL_406931 [Nephila pilipes]
MSTGKFGNFQWRILQCLHFERISSLVSQTDLRCNTQENTVCNQQDCSSQYVSSYVIAKQEEPAVLRWQIMECIYLIGWKEIKFISQFSVSYEHC